MLPVVIYIYIGHYVYGRPVIILTSWVMWRRLYSIYAYQLLGPKKTVYHELYIELYPETQRYRVTVISFSLLDHKF